MSYSDRGIEVSTNMNNLNLSHKQEDRNREVYISPRVRGDFWRKCKSLQYKSDKCRLQTADTPYPIMSPYLLEYLVLRLKNWEIEKNK